MGSPVKIKQEPIREVGNRGGTDGDHIRSLINGGQGMLKARQSHEPIRSNVQGVKSFFRGRIPTKLPGNGQNMQKLQQVKLLCSNVSVTASQRGRRGNI